MAWNRVRTGLDPLEFCDVCFQRGKPNLCETYKGVFTNASSLHFSVQNKLDRVLTKLDLQARRADGRWTCTASTKRKEFLDSLWGIGVSVHTLEDHAKVLSRLYKPDMRALGAMVPVELSETESWEEFDPKTRNWVTMMATKKGNKVTGSVHLGNVIKRSGMAGKNYFRSNLDEKITILVPMEKRAAYNIASTIAEQTTMLYKTDNTGEHAFIDTKHMGIIPDEIYSFLERIKVAGKKNSEMLIFDIEDFEIVKSILGSVKIHLERSSDVVAVSEKKSDDAVPIEKIEKSRLEVLSFIIKEMGGMISAENDSLTITGKHGKIKVTFAEDEKSTQDGNMIRVSVSALEEPARFVQILSIIQKRLGLLALPFENLTSQHWPIITDSDLQYVVQSAISWYSSNPVLASNIISGENKFAKVKEWYTKIKEGKIRSSLDTITLGKIIKQKESGRIK